MKFAGNTPKALANLSPGLERSDNPGNDRNKRINAESVRHAGITLSGFHKMFCGTPGLSLRSNPGLKLANVFGVFSTNFKLRHYQGHLSLCLLCPVVNIRGRCAPAGSPKASSLLKGEQTRAYRKLRERPSCRDR